MQAVIDEDPSVGDKSVSITFSTRSIKTRTGWQNVSERGLLFTNRYPEYHYGDLIQITGKLENPEPIEDFNYPAYIAQQDIYVIVSYPKVEVLATAQMNTPQQWLHSLRDKLSESIGKSTPEPAASLAQATVLGKSNNLPDDVKADFSRSGICPYSGNLWSAPQHTGQYSREPGYLAFRSPALLLHLVCSVRSMVLRSAQRLECSGCQSGDYGYNVFISRVIWETKKRNYCSFLSAAVMMGIEPSILRQSSFQMTFLAMIGLVFVTPVLQAGGYSIIATRTRKEGLMVSFFNFLGDSLSASFGAR